MPQFAANDARCFYGALNAAHGTIYVEVHSREPRRHCISSFSAIRVSLLVTLNIALGTALNAQTEQILIK